MQKIIIITLIFIAQLVFSSSFLASHVPGGNITYRCLGNNQFEITLTLYEDCGSAFETNSDENIDVVSSCGDNLSLSLTNDIFQQEISQLCPSSLAQSECNGGNLPGIYMHQWSGVITLPSQCDSWTFEYSSCCRNASSNLVGSTSSYYFYAILNNLDSPCNSSPTISAPPIPYYCVNQPVCYNLGIVETDGDSLVFSLVNALEDATTAVSYQGGFSGASPINGITIDTESGLVSFTPTAIGNFVVVIRVDEYLNGQLIGTIVQDFTFEIANCTNQIISCNNSSISNVTGSVTQTDPTTIQMCEGVPFSFDLIFTDPDAADSIFVESNVLTVLPGVVVSYSYPNLPSTNSMVMNVAWTPPPGSSNMNNIFTVIVRDNACPVSGLQTLVYTIDVIGPTYAGTDVTICQGDGVDITAVNGNVFNWTSISGDPITASNFSCQNCPSSFASPSTTTVYKVVSDLTGSCLNVDTVTVNVAPNFTYTLSQSAPSACLQADVQLEIIPDVPASYTYAWTPTDDLDNPTISNPVFTPQAPGTYDYSVIVSSPLGCVKYDTATVNVVAQYAPTLTLTQNTTLLNCGDSIIVNVDLGSGIPATCGPSATAPITPTIFGIVGTNSGANTSTGYPAPFGNFYKNAKHQFLFKASELQAMGLVGGVISRIDFEVTDMNNSTSTYNSYTVKMKNTGLNALTTWETGLTTVYAPQNTNISTGWNNLAFTTGYDWDGNCNIIVEVCYDNLGSSYTQNASTPYFTTPFVSSLYYRSDGTAACPYTSTESTSSKRPIIRFGMIPSTPDPTDFSYDWGTGNMTSLNGSLVDYFDIPGTNTDYQIVVTNIAGGCADSATVHVDASGCLLPLPNVSGATCFGDSDGSIWLSALGSDGPNWTMELLTIGGAPISSVANITDSTLFDNLLAGQYIVRVTDTLGLVADSIVTVLEPAPMVLTVGNDTIVCIGGDAILNASITGGNGIASYVFNWDGTTGTTSSETILPLVNNTYQVHVLDSLGCSSDTLDMTISLFPPILTSTEVTDTVCPGNVANITASANGGHGGTYSYNWFDESGTPVGAGSAIDVTPLVSGSIYYVEVTDDCQTPMERDSVIVFWYDFPAVNYTSDIDSGCYPVKIEFENLTPANEVSSLIWVFGDGANGSTNTDPIHIYENPGEYDVTLTVTSPQGCVKDTTIVNYIEVYEYPTALFSFFPDPANIFESTVAFTNESSSDAVIFEWFFNDSTLLGTSLLENPTFEFSSQTPDVYDVELVVTNANLCTDTILHEVIVNGVYTFFVPTAFSPNADGLNDFFLPTGEGIEDVDYSLMIFDRNGGIVFSSTSPNEQWDGTSLGSPVSSGIYVWKINTKDRFTGEEHEYYGNVSLIR